MVGKSTHSTELGNTFENFIEIRNINYGKPRHMTAELKIGGKMARTLFDTGTVGKNLMWLNWVQSNQIPTKKIENPVEIKMAVKNSRITARYSATADIDIGNSK